LVLCVRHATHDEGITLDLITALIATYMYATIVS